MTTHRYVSWLRLGAAAMRSDGAVADANPIVPAQLSVNGAAAPEMSVTLHGPGDIAGLTAAAIVRRDPAPNAVGISPSGIAFVELWPADLPWRFSPAAAASTAPQAAVLPWLTLVVVPAAAPIGPRAGAPLPVLVVARGELPDPGTLWAWAHVQVEELAAGIPAGQVASYLRDHPTSAVARLLAPRRLEPSTKYRACLVPVYEAGRRAGLGLDVRGAGVTLAWSAAATAATPIELPVYDSWLIETGAVADFETIARRLRGQDADGLFAPLALDVAAAAGQAPPLVATTYGLLRPPDGDTALPAAAQIASTLEPWLVTGDAAVAAVGPPLYAAAQTAATSLASAPPWQRTLNLDPRRRAQAAAGAAIVRADQEQLVADARAAIGQLDRANTLVRGTQLASLLSDRLRARHIAPRPPARVIATLWPTLAGTPVATAAAAPAPGATALLAPQMRRLARPIGPLARGRTAGLAWSRLNHDLTLQVAAAPIDHATTATLEGARVVSTAGVPMRALAPARIAEIQTGLTARRISPAPIARPAAPVIANATELAAQALAATSPLGIATRLAVRIQGVAAVATVAGLRELRPGPDLSRPLADRLAQLRPELFAPGLAELPPDTVSVLTVDPAAIEAILAGANDELSRELAWRGVAVDRRLTLLRQLWARPVRDPGPVYDIPPIASWTGALGAQAVAQPTVFVVRSELVRRFPDALYACVRAVSDPGLGRKPGDDHVLPVFRGLAAPDIAYVGFAAPLATLAGATGWKPGAPGDPGWYFTIQERPGHTRFGLDAQPSSPLLAWVNLSWADVIPDPADPFVHLTPPARRPATPPTWGATAASMASILERPAVRIALHIQELLPR